MKNPWFLLGLIAFFVGSVTSSAAEWSGFRGTDGSGRSIETKVVPEGSFALNLQWRRSIGSAYSGIALSKRQLFTMSAEEGRDRLVSLNADNGSLRWSLDLGPTLLGRDGSHDGALSTPAVGCGTVVALGPHGDLLAADAATGQVLWRQHLVRDLRSRMPHYGFSTSPRIVGDLVVVSTGGFGTAFRAFALDSGQELWSSGQDVVDYQSPVLWKREGREVIVATGNSRVLGLEPATGRILWQLEHEGGGTRGSSSLSPVPVGDALFLSHRDDASRLLLGFPDEIRTLWESRSIRNSYALPVEHEGILYGFSHRFLTAVEPTTGDRLWRSRIVSDGFPILVDGHLVVQTKKGEIAVLRIDRSGPELRASVPVFPEGSWTSPSFHEGSIYARGFDGIARLDPGAVDRRPGVVASRNAPYEGPGIDFWTPLRRALAESSSSATEADTAPHLLEDFIASHGPLPVLADGAAHFLYAKPAHDVALVGDLAGVRNEIPLHPLTGAAGHVLSVPVPADAEFSYGFSVDFSLVVDPSNPRNERHPLFGPELEPVAGGDLLLSWHGPEVAVSQAGRPRGLPLRDLDLASEILGADVHLVTTLSELEARAEASRVLLVVFGGPTAPDGSNLAGTIEDLDLPVDLVFVLDRGSSHLETTSSFFLRELLPWIEETRGAPLERNELVIAGMGWEGLTALRIGIEHGERIGGLALQSVTALTHPEGGLTKGIRSYQGARPIVYIDWGTFDLRSEREAWNVGVDNRRLFEAFEAAGCEPAGGQTPAGTGWASWNRRTRALLDSLLSASRRAQP